MAFGDLNENAILDFETLQNLLGLADDDEPMASDLINKATSYIEVALRGWVKARSRTVVLNGTGRPLLVLPDYPVQSLTSVYVDPLRVFGEDTLVTDAFLVGDEGMLHRDTCWPKGFKNIKLTGVFGWDPIPEDLIDCCVKVFRSNWDGYRDATYRIKAQTGINGERTEYNVGIPIDAFKILTERQKAVTSGA